MRRLPIVLVISITLLGVVALGAPTITLGIGAKMWNDGAFVVLNHVSGSLGIELGIGPAGVEGSNPHFRKWAPAAFLDMKLYYPLKSLHTGFFINPYVGGGVMGVHFDRPLGGIGSGTVTAVAVEAVSGVDICLSQLRIPITFVFAVYVHAIRGAILSYAGETYPAVFWTEVPKGFQLGIRVDF